MTRSEVVKRVYELALPIAQENGLEIDDVEFVKEGPTHYLRVFIDKEGGIFVNDCEVVSRALDVKLDELESEITVSYILEVSSPGIDKVLKKEKDFIKYKGRDVDVKLYKAIDGQKEFQGVLVSLENDKLTIIVEDDEVEFDYSLVSQVRLAVIF